MRSLAVPGVPVLSLAWGWHHCTAQRAGRFHCEAVPWSWTGEGLELKWRRHFNMFQKFQKPTRTRLGSFLNFVEIPPQKCNRTCINSMSDTALAFVAPTRGPPGWPPDQRSD